ncbi:MAG: DNA repair protein RecO, partial [Streptococcaceae bacterium]|nr:DNA repair protein RecO [Streptococcaceae bacterium]
VNLLRMFEKIEYRRIGQVGVRKETKVELRRARDLLYEEYVGIHLKSKKFLDDMEKWENKW